MKEELERATGQPIQLTPEERQKLAAKAEGIDPETLKQISIFDLEDPELPDSIENQ